jgi:hypothetical protein
VEVRLFEEGYGGYCNHGFTDDNGEIFGGAPANAAVKMEVVGGNACGSVLLNRYFVTNAEPVDLGDITIPQQPNIEVHISGMVKDCNGNPVSNGRIILFKNGFYECRYLSANGTYDFISYLCSGSAPSQIFAQDISNHTQSNAIDFVLVFLIIESCYNVIFSKQVYKENTDYQLAKGDLKRRFRSRLSDYVCR